MKKITNLRGFADTKPHYELLDGLRGVAALLVIVYHIFEGFALSRTMNQAGSGIIEPFNHGHLAVDFFFMLSGFVISYAYDDRWERLSVAEFCKRRLIRLQPMLILGAILGAVSFLASGCERWSGSTTPTGWVMIALLLTMFMIPALPGMRYEVRGYGEMYSLNGPAWSLFFEYIGNLLYALIIRRLSTKLLAWLVLVLGVIHVWFFATNVSGYDSIGVGWTMDTVNFFGGMTRMLFPFVVGMLLSRKFKPQKLKGVFWLCSAMLVATFTVPNIAFDGNFSLNSLYEVACVMFVFPIIVYLGACGYGDNKQVVAINRFLGDISYPIYIVHYPLMYLFYMWVVKNQQYDLNDTVAVPILLVLASVVLAYVSLKLYDEPVRRWLVRKFIK